MLRFADPIIAARKAGKRPAALVIVSDGDHSLHRRYPQNPVVRIDATDRPSLIDWTFLAGLAVEIATAGDYRRTTAIINAILPARPDYLRVWWIDVDLVVRIKWGSIQRVEPETFVPEAKPFPEIHAPH